MARALRRTVLPEIWDKTAEQASVTPAACLAYIKAYLSSVHIWYEVSKICCRAEKLEALNSIISHLFGNSLRIQYMYVCYICGMCL